MQVTILGVENVSYVSKKSNQQVIGVTIYFAYPLDPSRGFGMKAEKAFLSQRVQFTAQVGDKVDILYNRFGSVEEVRVLETKK